MELTGWQRRLLDDAVAVARGDRFVVLMPRAHEPVAPAWITEAVEAYVAAAMSERRREEERLVASALRHCATLTAVERLHLVDQEGCAPAVASSWWPTE